MSRSSDISQLLSKLCADAARIQSLQEERWAIVIQTGSTGEELLSLLYWNLSKDEATLRWQRLVRCTPSKTVRFKIVPCTKLFPLSCLSGTPSEKQELPALLSEGLTEEEEGYTSEASQLFNLYRNESKRKLLQEALHVTEAKLANSLTALQNSSQPLPLLRKLILSALERKGNRALADDFRRWYKAQEEETSSDGCRCPEASSPEEEVVSPEEPVVCKEKSATPSSPSSSPSSSASSTSSSASSASSASSSASNKRSPKSLSLTGESGSRAKTKSVTSRSGCQSRTQRSPANSSLTEEDSFSLSKARLAHYQASSTHTPSSRTPAVAPSLQPLLKRAVFSGLVQSETAFNRTGYV